MPILRLTKDAQNGYILRVYSDKNEDGRIYAFGGRRLQPDYAYKGPIMTTSGTDPAVLIENYFKENARIRSLIREGCKMEFLRGRSSVAKECETKFKEEYEKFIQNADTKEWNEEIEKAKTEASRLYDNWLPAPFLLMGAILIAGLIAAALAATPIGLPIVMGAAAIACGVLALAAYESKYSDRRVRQEAVEERRQQGESLRTEVSSSVPAPAQTVELSPPPSAVQPRSASLPVLNQTLASDPTNKPTDKPRKNFS